MKLRNIYLILRWFSKKINHALKFLDRCCDTTFMKVGQIPPFMNFTQQISDMNKAGNVAGQMKIMVKQIDRDREILENPAIMQNMEVFPNDIRESSTDLAYKLLDVI